MTAAPPFRLPGIHFARAVLWLVLGGVGLVVIAPELAAAATHVYTLGVIVAMVFSALYQFYPVSFGAGARSVRVGIAGRGCSMRASRRSAMSTWALPRWWRRLGIGLAQLLTPGLSLRGRVVYAELTLLGWLVLFITGIWYRLFTSSSGCTSTAVEMKRGRRPRAGAPRDRLAGAGAPGTWRAAPGCRHGWELHCQCRDCVVGDPGGSLLILVQYARIFSAR